jgi:uncharacterized iron-regulated membrane protein
MSAAAVTATKIVDVGQLAQVIYVALIAGVLLSLAFSLVIRGSVRAGEHGRARPFLAGVHVLLAAIGLLIVAGAIVYGISVMLSK